MNLGCDRGFWNPIKQSSVLLSLFRFTKSFIERTMLKALLSQFWKQFFKNFVVYSNQISTPPSSIFESTLSCLQTRARKPRRQNILSRYCLAFATCHSLCNTIHSALWSQTITQTNHALLRLRARGSLRKHHTMPTLKIQGWLRSFEKHSWKSGMTCRFRCRTGCAPKSDITVSD